MKKEVKIPNMTCGGCAMRIEQELDELENTSIEFISMDEKRVEIKWDEPTTWEKIKKALSDIDYPAEELS